MRTLAKRALWMTAAAALAAGCVVDNPASGIDGGADTDVDSDADTDADAGEDAGTTLACDENGDICHLDADGDPVGVAVDCPDQNSVCVEPDGGPPECQCEGHFDLASDCLGCATGYGGAACAICEIGYTGSACDDCVYPYVAAAGACVYGELCGSDSVWLDDGALPGTTRPDEEFGGGGEGDEFTIIDTITGLEWQRCPAGMTPDGVTCAPGSPSMLTSTNAIVHCATEYGGYTDWRLPEASELASIVDYGSIIHVNSTFFAYYAGVFWTSTIAPSSPPDHLAVTLGTLVVEPPVTGQANVVCVRDVDPPSPASPRFALGTFDGSTVLDLWTDLEWRRCVYGQLWSGTACTNEPELYEPFAVAPADDDDACEDDYGSLTGWRVPSAAEMTSLLAWCDAGRPYFIEAFATDLYPEAACATYWTSTVAPETSGFYAYSFSTQTMTTYDDPVPMPVLCVRDPD